MKRYLPYALVFFAGVVLASRVRALPGGDKIPVL